MEYRGCEFWGDSSATAYVGKIAGYNERLPFECIYKLHSYSTQELLLPSANSSW